ncbi:unnamed protein product [Rotaria sp. Silwood1]|nr:unnamed protein product [Rotaria sp. Silwood1]CAF1622448.1 unnamed protein product [Rotaria sp. Silwood1]CAF1623606.1 unnamed protein product [Rotaria sp. Silwood1]CAF3738806.1 unnamed protein product [Rotaria sp. Silwood1]CAF3752063.1 unnamed protein product [Rotaria sp. Silwood1]
MMQKSIMILFLLILINTIVTKVNSHSIPFNDHNEQHQLDKRNIFSHLVKRQINGSCAGVLTRCYGFIQICYYADVNGKQCASNTWRCGWCIGFWW